MLNFSKCSALKAHAVCWLCGLEHIGHRFKHIYIHLLNTFQDFPTKSMTCKNTSDMKGEVVVENAEGRV